MSPKGSGRMTTNSLQWARVEALFTAALELGAGQDRETYLAQATADDPNLLGEVRDMLRGHESDAPLEIEKRLFPEDDACDPLVGSAIGPYRIERRLGRGGMGDVYLAQREEHQFRHQVALKLLRAGWHGP